MCLRCTYAPAFHCMLNRYFYHVKKYQKTLLSSHLFATFARAKTRTHHITYRSGCGCCHLVLAGVTTTLWFRSGLAIGFLDFHAIGTRFVRVVFLVDDVRLSFCKWMRIWYTTCNIACICPRNGHRKGSRQPGGFDLSDTWNEKNDGSRIIDTNFVVRRQQQ